jgi:hypothetical protein
MIEYGRSLQTSFAEMFKADQGKLEQSTFECDLSDKLLGDLPNSADIITVDGRQYPSSIVELHRPTGKYISRALIKLFNLFSQKRVIRIIGNTCAPGLKFPVLISGKGIDQFENLPNKCPIIAANILGYEEFPNAVTVKGEPIMVLNIPEYWNSFEDYISAFTSKYRVRAKKTLKETKEVEVKKLSDLPPNQWIASCANLLNQSLSTKTIAIGRNLPKLLSCYHQSLGENFEVWGYYQEGDLIGFISCIRDDKKLFAMHLGLKKQENPFPKLYSRMLLDMVKWAIDNDLERVNFGRTGAEIKSTLGAIPVENSFVVFTRSRFLLQLFKVYARYFQKKFIYTLQQPFKEPKAEKSVPFEA